MAKSFTDFPRVAFPPTTRPRRITKLGVVGMGECVRKKIWPIVQSEAFPLDDLVVCSMEPRSCLDGFPHRYYQLQPDGFLPLDELHEQGFLSTDTLWLICPPSEYHVHYAVQLAGLCRVAVEKPLADTSHRARLSLPFTDGFDVHPMSHKVFNASVLAFIDACRQDPCILQRVCHIEGVFYETAGLSHGRQLEDCIADVQWHLFTAGLIAPFKATATYFEVVVDKVWVATHEPDPQERYAQPTVWTASRVQGRLLGDWQEVTYDFRQAKGAPTSMKGVRLFDGAGNLLHEIDLNESGCHAHARMLLALMRPVVDMRLTLADAIAVMEWIDISRGLACEEPAYAFGTLPGFLA